MLRMTVTMMATITALRTWVLVGVSVVSAATLGGPTYRTAMSPADESFFEVDKCDLCLGTSLCSEILGGDVLIEDWSPARPGPDGGGGSSRPAAHRTRYRGRHRNEAEAWRLVEAARPLERRLRDALDASLCAGRSADRSAAAACGSARDTPRFRRWMRAKRLTADLVQGLRAPLLACPSQRLLDRIVRRFAEASDGGSVYLHHLDAGDRLRLLFTLAAAPQLILQQMFPTEEGWPFARYVGACGRLAVSVGTVPLAEFIGADAEHIADLAYQALAITAGMTDNDFGYLLYFTTMHGAVFGVRCDGRLRVADTGVVGVIDHQQRPGVQTRLTAEYSDDIFSTLWDNTSQPVTSPPPSPTPPSSQWPSNPCEKLPSRKELEARNVALVCRWALRPLLTGAFQSPRGLQQQVDSLLALCEDQAMGPRVVSESAGWLRSLLASLRPCRPDFPYRYPECRYSGGGL